MESDGVIVHMWCGPRSLSTATMYSFSQRPDTMVIDEPLYASHLAKNPQLYRPYREELLQQHETDGNKVLACLQETLRSSGKRVLFLKHIAKQIEGLDLSLLRGPNVRHMFLVRNPLDMIHSWGVKGEIHQEGFTIAATSLPELVRLYSEFKAIGNTPVVVDSENLRKFPFLMLPKVCAELGIQYFEEQLSWPAGPKPCDGLWAKYWYDRVHATTSYQDDAHAASAVVYKTFSVEQLEIYRDVLPFYELLHRRSIGVDKLCTASWNPTYDFHTGSCSGENSVAVSEACPPVRTAQLDDRRNSNLLIWVGNRVVPRELATVSVFDSAVQGGDAVWEGLRVYSGRVFKLDEHLDRLMNSARAMAFKSVPPVSYIRTAIFKTLAANGMRNNAHMRLTLTRGGKITSSMNPNFNVFGCNLLIVPEWKPVGDAATYNNSTGITLITASGRRNSPQCVDSKIHHNNLINNILPKIEANLYGAADALMLDSEGFVSETNATNVFMIKNGKVLTPHADYCLPGITRATVISIVQSLGISLVERRISLSEFHSADEVFTTGTMGELTPVTMIDGRPIGRLNTEGVMDCSVPGPILQAIQAAYRALTETEGTPIPDFN